MGRVQFQLDGAHELFVVAPQHVVTGGHHEPADCRVRGARHREDERDDARRDSCGRRPPPRHRGARYSMP